MPKSVTACSPAVYWPLCMTGRKAHLCLRGPSRGHSPTWQHLARQMAQHGPKSGFMDQFRGDCGWGGHGVTTNRGTTLRRGYGQAWVPGRVQGQ
eukprot:9220031-Pyramimonas_sp.AAC.1